VTFAKQNQKITLASKTKQNPIPVTPVPWIQEVIDYLKRQAPGRAISDFDELVTAAIAVVPVITKAPGETVVLVDRDGQA